MKRYWWVVILLVLVVTGTIILWLASRIQPKTPSLSKQPSFLPSSVTVAASKINSLNPFLNDKQKLESKLAEFRTNTQNIPQPELTSETDLVGWKEEDPERERYQIIGTVSDYENGRLTLASNQNYEINTDNQTIFACMENASSNTQLKDYTNVWIDYQRFIPFDVEPNYLETQFNLSTYTPETISSKILKNSWAYVWVLAEKWNNNDKTASIIILTYCGL